MFYLDHTRTYRLKYGKKHYTEDASFFLNLPCCAICHPMHGTVVWDECCPLQCVDARAGWDTILVSKLGRRMCYHCATEAGGFGENKKNDILNLRIVYTEKMKMNLEFIVLTQPTVSAEQSYPMKLSCSRCLNSALA